MVTNFSRRRLLQGAAALGAAGALPPIARGAARANPDRQLRDRAESGLRGLVATDRTRNSGVDHRAYAARLERELTLVTRMGAATHLLRAAHVVDEARALGFRVAPGSGGVGCSLVAWCLGITDIDPLRHELPFERFLNAERQTVLYIGIAVSRAGYQALVPRVSSRLGAPRLESMGELAGWPLASVFDGPKGDGPSGASGRGPGGSTEIYVSAWPEMDALEAALGQGRCDGEIDATLSSLDYDDPGTLASLGRHCPKPVGYEDGLETNGITLASMLERFPPASLDDLATAMALHRLSTLQSGLFAEVVNQRERNRSGEPPRGVWSRQSEAVQRILAPTYGALVFQEQLMRIVTEVSGLGLDKAEVVRRALGGKRKSEMAIQQERFVAGATARGMSPHAADHVWWQLKRAIFYMFNQSHALAVAKLMFQRAWFERRFRKALEAPHDETDRHIS